MRRAKRGGGPLDTFTRAFGGGALLGIPGGGRPLGGGAPQPSATVAASAPATLPMAGQPTLRYQEASAASSMHDEERSYFNALTGVFDPILTGLGQRVSALASSGLDAIGVRNTWGEVAIAREQRVKQLASVSFGEALENKPQDWARRWQRGANAAIEVPGKLQDLSLADIPSMDEIRWLVANQAHKIHVSLAVTAFWLDREETAHKSVAGKATVAWTMSKGIPNPISALQGVGTFLRTTAGASDSIPRIGAATEAHARKTVQNVKNELAASAAFAVAVRAMIGGVSTYISAPFGRFMLYNNRAVFAVAVYEAYEKMEKAFADDPHARFLREATIAHLQENGRLAPPPPRPPKP